MNDLRRVLRDADPMRGDGGLSSADAARIRARMLSASTRPTRRWGRVAFSAVALACAAAAAWLAFVLPGADDLPSDPGLPAITIAWHPGVPIETALSARVDPPAVVAPAPSHELTVRQVRFVAPGGTQVIWFIEGDRT